VVGKAQEVAMGEASIGFPAERYDPISVVLGRLPGVSEHVGNRPAEQDW
jgi:hypothetical protein